MENKLEIGGKEYTVRGLQVADIGSFSKILEKMDFRLSAFLSDTGLIQAALKRGPQDHKKKGEDKQLAQTVGVEAVLRMIDYLIQNYHKAEEELNTWLASLIGVKPDAFKKMPIATPYKILEKLAGAGDLLDFFAKAAQ